MKGATAVKFKQIFQIWFSACMLFVLAGCSQQLMGMNKEYKPKKKDVVDMHGQVENLVILDEFVDDVNEKKESSVRVVRYTIEGDPIFYTLKYDGSEIDFTFDNTHDEFGVGMVDKNTCQSILKEETDTSLRYTLGECEGIQGAVMELLAIDYDVQKQDRFEFDFRYGGNSFKSDAFSPEDLQQIYKKMVLNSYLNEKDLKTCQSAQRYELTVWINGAKQEYEWGSCDKGVDAAMMTEISDEIIKLGTK